MALTAVIACTITALEQSSFRTVTVRFASPTIPPQLPILSIPNTTFPPTAAKTEATFPSPTHYWLNFETIDGQLRDDGVLSAKFGYNALLQKDVSPGNLSTLDGIQVKIRYRYRSLPWAPATQLPSEIAKHFQELLPKVEWDNSRKPNTWMAAG